MTEVDIKKETEMEEVKETPRKPVYLPDFCSYEDDEGTGTVMEVVLPGVEKDTIKLKMHEDSVFISGESDSLRYVGSYMLCCPVEPEKAKATYKNGLLKITVPYKELDFSTIDVPIE